MSKAASWQAAPHSPADNLRFAEPHERRLPAWMLSMGLHVLIVVALGVGIRVEPRGAAKEPDRTGGIVLVEHSQGEPKYFAEADVTVPAAPSQSSANDSPTDNPLMALPSE